MKFFLLFVAAIVFFTVSCSDGTQNDKNKLIPCTTSDDCSGGLECISGFCTNKLNSDECDEENKCPEGFECINNKCELKSCSSKDDCGVGFICFNENCIPGCDNNQDCVGDKVCNIETHVCEDNNKEDCREKSEPKCPQGYICSELSGDCELRVSCNKDEDCIPEQRCNDGACLERVRCIPENNGAECDTGEVCRPDGYCGVDTGCDSDDYCINKDPSKPACNINSGICYECINDSYCSNGEKCDLDRYICGNADDLTCQSDEDCGLNRKCQPDGTCVSIFGRECGSDGDCTELDQGRCLTSADPHRCVQCLQDDHCQEGQVCNRNTYLCENAGSGAECQDDSECNILAGESCVDGHCYNPNASGNEGSSGLCDLDYGGTLCYLFGGKCSGDIVECFITTGDGWCGDCLFEE